MKQLKDLIGLPLIAMIFIFIIQIVLACKNIDGKVATVSVSSITGIGCYRLGIKKGKRKRKNK